MTETSFSECSACGTVKLISKDKLGIRGKKRKNKAWDKVPLRWPLGMCHYPKSVEYLM